MRNRKPKFSSEQADALNGKTEMTEALFWECLDMYWCSYDMKAFSALWNQYPQYVQAYFDKLDREWEDPDSPVRMREEQYWQELKAKLRAEFGEEWLEEHLAQQ